MLKLYLFVLDQKDQTLQAFEGNMLLSIDGQFKHGY